MDSIKELVDRAESEFGHLDIMVNNAGVGGGFLWIDTDSTTHSSAIDINFKAPVEGTRLAVRSFYAANRPGCVVNIASIVAFTPLEYSPVYSATKAALVAFTAVSAPLAEGTPPVRVNAVAPVYIDTAIVNENVTEKVNGLLRGLGERTVDDVAREVVRCIEDELLAGDTIVMRPEGPGKVATQVPKAESLGFIKHINKQANSSP
ncbi:hypothetical protein GGI25_000013 [Coemansia spiralis]|uniref:Uncharacterized protein n=2 Tax=Coemansia TaxID=4863 RepID=A0A9W8GCP8_9FUNG|nr:hypothetical protein BX070DRAFT_249782 [Coemansia spiralis]KAJ2681060.1 hypothetical protein GGI25_000013 [Coemansia spiralis]